MNSVASADGISFPGAADVLVIVAGAAGLLAATVFGRIAGQRAATQSGPALPAG
jgi:hypothetical protein